MLTYADRVTTADYSAIPRDLEALGFVPRGREADVLKASYTSSLRPHTLVTADYSAIPRDLEALGFVPRGREADVRASGLIDVLSGVLAELSAGDVC
jgi:hypothetical protein